MLLVTRGKPDTSPSGGEGVAVLTPNDFRLYHACSFIITVLFYWIPEVFATCVERVKAIPLDPLIFTVAHLSQRPGERT